MYEGVIKLLEERRGQAIDDPDGLRNLAIEALLRLDDRRPDETPIPETFPGLPGESWEQYARRLEKRIKEQRTALDSFQKIRMNGNIHARKRIEMLERSLGKACLAADRRKEQRDEIIEQLAKTKKALKIAYPYVMDALNEAETNYPDTAHIVRDDLEQHIVPALKEKNEHA